MPNVKKLLTKLTFPLKTFQNNADLNPSAIMRGFKDFTGQTMTDYRNQAKKQS